MKEIHGPVNGSPQPQRVTRSRHPEGCAFCPDELLGVERDMKGDPLCADCPHRREGST